MCGLAGRFHPDRLTDAGDWHSRADRLLAHRGPDGHGHFRDDRCELVHRRLAIIDLSPRGGQPMQSEDGRVVCVFNGEIYNYRELRADLERRGHRFRSTADTEVLVHLYEEDGERMVDKLRGIFAFAIYDRLARRLLLARDRYGVKPLFFAKAPPNDQYVFASELKAITALPGFNPRIDRQACYDFIGLGYVPEPATGFAEIAAVPAGRTVSISPQGEHPRCYYVARAAPDATLRGPEVVGAFSDRLMAAIERQTIADVPVASLLSGGIDSSLVVAAHQRATGGDIATFNVRFPDPGHDETNVARAVAEHYRTNHETVDIEQHRLTPESVLDLLRHFDQPFADTALIPTYWVARAMADRHIVCALSGDGGDEAFGGYPRFWRAHRLLPLTRAPGWIRGLTHRAGSMLSHHTRDLGRQISKASRLADAARDDSAVLLAGMSNYLSEDQKAQLFVPDAREQLYTSFRHFDGYEPSAAHDIEDLSRRMTETLFRVSLPSKMLRKVDMMSMRAGIEMRVPLLDEALVAMGLVLPHRLKTNGRTGKCIPRALARRWLPSEVARHRKHGFDIPLDIMVPRALHTAIRDLLTGADSRTRPLVNQALVGQWIHQFSNQCGSDGIMSRAGVYQRIFTLLSLELWLRDHQLTW